MEFLFFIFKTIFTTVFLIGAGLFGLVTLFAMSNGSEHPAMYYILLVALFICGLLLYFLGIWPFIIATGIAIGYILLLMLAD